jgi:hypothetical protein
MMWRRENVEKKVCLLLVKRSYKPIVHHVLFISRLRGEIKIRQSYQPLYVPPLTYSNLGPFEL